jgi:hypothetical protein
MMTMTNPITPPPDLVQQWVEKWHRTLGLVECRYEYIATQAAQWGADQELEACLRHLDAKGHHPTVLDALRATRRPKPPSLKEQALASLAELESPGRCDEPGYESLYNTIRLALESLDG